jgi:hypothetical protein
LLVSSIEGSQELPAVPLQRSAAAAFAFSRAQKSS